MNYSPGDYLTVWVNQGEREAMVLAVIGDDALIEYEMPNGTTALRILRFPNRGYKIISYKNLPKKWLRAIVEAGTEWIGNPQQGSTRARPVLDRENLRVISSAEINKFRDYKITQDQQEGLNAAQEVLDRLNFTRSKTNQEVLDDLIKGASGGAAGPSRWEEEDPGDAFPWYDDDDHTWYRAYYNLIIGRDEQGRRYVEVLQGDDCGDWQPDLIWDEREGNTLDDFSEVADFLWSSAYRYFKGWAEYFIWMAENGRDPLKEWMNPILAKDWFWKNLKSALENISGAVHAASLG